MDLDFVCFGGRNDGSRETPEKSVAPKGQAGGRNYSQDVIRDRATAPFVRLHNEILRLVDVELPNESEKKVRKSVLEEVTMIVKQVYPSAVVQVFGSEATGVLTRSSDLDIAVTVIPTAQSSSSSSSPSQPLPSCSDGSDEEKDEEEVAPEDTDKMMLKISACLQRAKVCSYVEVINARVPIIKLDHAASGLGVDICVNNVTGVTAAQFVARQCRQHPALRPLGMVLKIFLAQRGLNETFTGGIGSFVLLSMILSFLQHREKAQEELGLPPTRNLGVLLVDFLDLYGSKFNYVETGISLNGTYFSKRARQGDWFDASRPFALCIENPTEKNNDMGKGSYFITKVRRAFEHAKQVLQAVIVREHDSRGQSILELLIKAPLPGASSSNGYEEGSDLDLDAAGVSGESPVAKKRKLDKTYDDDIEDEPEEGEERKAKKNKKEKKNKKPKAERVEKGKKENKKKKAQKATSVTKTKSNGIAGRAGWGDATLSGWDFSKGSLS
jgi:non-canonical poly(A) RNA polymerase PAPD5/7